MLARRFVLCEALRTGNTMLARQTSQTRHRAIPVWKRIFDVVVASIALIATIPFMLVIAFCIRAKMGSPVLFRQRRPGLAGRPFTIYKFRTMRIADTCDTVGDERRITRLGAFLRRTSLDELPELWNVLRGEMSIVGPRPLLLDYLDLYSPEQRRRHKVLPGLTGWAQVNGRNAVSWEERLAMDTWYVDHRSFWLDVRIVLLTGIQVLKREGIDYAHHVTMPRFVGSVRSSSSEQ